MITKPFLQDVDHFGRVALACREVAYQDYLGIEISKDKIMHTIQCENVNAHICQVHEGECVGVSSVVAFWA